jgi:hypothetical protein
MDDTKNLFSLEGRALGSVLRKWWKPIAGVTLIAFTAAAVFSGPAFIKPVFKSRAVVYPSNMASYATENPTEQMIQMFESEDIRDRAIADFGLMKHYGVDPNGKFPLTELYGLYAQNVKVSKTQYESAELTVFDHDPQRASDLCDSLLSYLNQKVISLHRSKYAEVVTIHKDRLDEKKLEMDSMEAAIKRLRTEYGILEFEEQVKPFSKAYYRAMEAGKAGRGDARLDREQAVLAEKGGDYVSLKEHLWRVRGQYNDIKQQYELALTDLTKNLTYVNVVTRPYPAEKKTYPLRMLIVLAATASALFFAFLAALVFEKLKPAS